MCSLPHGAPNDEIEIGQARRFDSHPIHSLCYHSSISSAEELRQCITDSTEGQEQPEEDTIGMTTFHMVCYFVEPRHDLFLVLLEKHPRCVLGRKDVNGKRAMDYLITIWTRETSN